ncbi:MAG: hypothetical protein H6838_18650 [Planctomycetes bacterium]|nr:hypothetical protein [Planctomycetota bacterium]
MFFLILLVMFLGALGFAYVKLTENGELIKQRNEAKAEAETARKKSFLVEHYIEDIGRVIGKPGKYEGRPQSKALYGDATLENALLMNPAEVQKLLDDACQAAGVSKASGLENVLGAMTTKVGQLGQRVKDIESERDKAMADKTEVDRKFVSATADATSRARDFSQKLEQTTSEFEAAKQDKERTIANLTQNLNDKRDELATTKEAATTREKELNGEIRKHQMQNSALVARDAMRNPVDTADGKVLAARSGIPTAFINLGKKDMLQPGTMFRVKNPNSAAVKAYGTVTRVEEERAEIALTGVVDPIGDAVREGDLLFNDLYTPRVSRTIYLMGRFSAPYNKPELTDLLKRLGNKVVTKMGPGVDTVILGDDPLTEEGDAFAKITDSVEYKEALDLRVEFAALRKIRDLIKL